MPDETKMPPAGPIPGKVVLAPPNPPPGQPGHVSDPKAPTATAPADSYSPYTGPSEIIEGGSYLRGTRMSGGKHYGGQIVNGNGDVLATFENDQENDGNPASGKKPEKN